MFFLILFFFFSCAASNDIRTVIVHMPGVADGGFNFLNPTIFPDTGINFKIRHNQELNPTQTFNQFFLLSKCLIYTNNICLKDTDFGGRHCVTFYKNMILEAHKQYPHANLILVGGSQGSVGPFGALAELIQENHTVLPNIKKVMVEAVLGSIHETFNFHAYKIPLIKILPRYSEKIIPLLMEYLTFFIGTYDAFAPQLYHYIEQINKSDAIDHINFLMLHDINDEIIPVSCAQKAAQLLEKNNRYIETKVNAERYLTDANELRKFRKMFTHLPSNANENEKMIVEFLQQPATIKENLKKANLPTVDNWFISKSKFQKFMLRRARDGVILTLFFGFIFCCYKTIQAIQSFA